MINKPKSNTASSLSLRDLDITYLPVELIRSAVRNPRTHSQKQIEQITKSIRTFGFTNPVLLDDENTLIAGHGRVEAAKIIGIEKIPTIRLSHMSEAQKRAYIIADNKIAENAGWDEELLSVEFSYLADLDLDFDITVTGFETPEIDLLLENQEIHEESEETTLLIPQEPISKLGDIWQLGPHRIICGDATDPETFKKLMKDDKANLIFTDPPYNVPVNGHICGAGSVQHREFVMASGEMDSSQFTDFLRKSFQNLVNFSIDGSLHYICMDWRHMKELLTAGEIFTELKNLCVWNKTNGGMGSLYRSKHELIFVFKNGTSAHTNNIKLGEHGRYRTNVWDYPGVNTFQREELSFHPTVKPWQMVADAIQDCSHRGDIILDAFGGSGTTLLAAERTGRRGFLIEMDPRYVDVTIQRYMELTQKDVLHAVTNVPFSSLNKDRHE